METQPFYIIGLQHLLLETKYRDIADGNISSRLAAFFVLMLETKYRDIADGNLKAWGSRL